MLNNNTSERDPRSYAVTNKAQKKKIFTRSALMWSLSSSNNAEPGCNLSSESYTYVKSNYIVCGIVEDSFLDLILTG